ncbi:CNNM domain-containing protein [Sorangium sp. So ce281]|uniref:CNNM domain-containing protein n=1 Tax=unclassified Sorangium TaxID=2621164 RepID=UPI003F635675
MTSADWVGLGAVAVLILLAALMAAAEVVITRMSRIRAYRLREEDRHGAASLVRLVDDPAPHLNVVLLLTLLFQLAGTTIAGSVALRVLGGYGDLVATLIMTVLLFVLAEAMPKTFAVQHTDRIALRLAPMVLALGAMLGPVGYSRIPIYDAGLDELVGVLYAKDVVREFHAGHVERPLSGIAQTPRLVPESKKVAELLKEMQRDKFHMALVVDEHGTLGGLVTLEDVLEEIVGEIADEYDREEPNVKPVGEKAYRVNARTSVDQLRRSEGRPTPPGRVRSLAVCDVAERAHAVRRPRPRAAPGLFLAARAARWSGDP